MLFKTLVVSAMITIGGGEQFDGVKDGIMSYASSAELVADDIKLINDVADMYIKINGQTKKYYKSSQTIKIPCKSGLEIFEADSNGSVIRTLFEVDDYKDYCGKEIKLSKILD